MEHRREMIEIFHVVVIHLKLAVGNGALLSGLCGAGYGCRGSD